MNNTVLQADLHRSEIYRRTHIADTLVICQKGCNYVVHLFFRTSLQQLRWLSQIVVTAAVTVTVTSWTSSIKDEQNLVRHVAFV